VQAELQREVGAVEGGSVVCFGLDEVDDVCDGLWGGGGEET